VQTIENKQLVIQKLGMSHFEADYQPVFDYDRQRSVEVATLLMWIMSIRINSSSANLGFLKTSDWNQVVLIPLMEDVNAVAIRPIRISNDKDTVTPALQNMNLVYYSDIAEFDADDDFALLVNIESKHMGTQFDYISGVPDYRSNSMTTLWDGIKSLVNHVVVQSENRQLTQFVKENWWILPKDKQ